MHVCGNHLIEFPLHMEHVMVKVHSYVTYENLDSTPSETVSDYIFMRSYDVLAGRGHRYVIEYE